MWCEPNHYFLNQNKTKNSKVVIRCEFSMFSINSNKNASVLNIFGTPGNCIKIVGHKKIIPLRTSANKNHHREFGRVTLRLALEASLRSPAGMGIVKHIENNVFLITSDEH